MFAVTEIWVFHIQVGREAQSISISEVPLILALFYSMPQDLLIARVVGSALVMLLHRRQTLLKSGVNAALMFADTTVALVVFRIIGGGSTADGGREWVAGVAACAAAMAVDLVVLSLIIRWYDGKPPLSGVRSLVSGVGIAAASGVLGLMPLLTLRLGRARRDPPGRLRRDADVRLPGLRLARRPAHQPRTAVPVQPRAQRRARVRRRAALGAGTGPRAAARRDRGGHAVRRGRHLGHAVRRRAGTRARAGRGRPGHRPAARPAGRQRGAAGARHRRRCGGVPALPQRQRGRDRAAALRRPDRRCAGRARPDG